MNYALARELKAAGLPFREIKTPSSDIQAALMATTGFSNEEFVVFKDEPKVYYIPTLSELIEACEFGQNLFRLTWDSAEWECSTDKNFMWSYGRSSTPEEAVARLWLALNKHD